MVDEIRKRLNRLPFVPFSVSTSDDHQHSVPALDHAFITLRGNRVVVVDDEGTTAAPGPLHINNVVEQANGE